MLKVGTRAPQIEGVLDDGSRFSLDEALGTQNLVLYFYPKDFTGGCTRQACSFRDNFAEITARGALLIGVSSDDEASHAAFREAHDLPFPLLADPGGRIIDLYDARGPFGLGKARITYVIDRKGVIRAAIRHDLVVGKHVPEVIDALEEIGASEAAGCS